jgi:hypothetical protein
MGICPILCSTDYVFSGKTGHSSEETTPEPLCEYGRQKTELERLLKKELVEAYGLAPHPEKGVPHGYMPDHTVNMAFLGANTPGEWAVGNFWGPLGNETRAWLDHLATGSPTVHTTPEQARINLETTIAIQRAADTGKAIRLPLET